MKRKIFVLIAASLLIAGCRQNANKHKGIDYTQFVNPFIGTGSVDSLSLSGSNFPGACLPFGLVQLSPDTREYPDDP